MLYYIVKLFASAFVILLVSEIAKRSSLVGALVASLPLTSFIAISWIYFETKNTVVIADLTRSIFWLILPSMSFFIIFPILLRKGVNFFLAMSGSTVVMVLIYLGMIAILKKFPVA
jgi:hypothetical protein